jgi:hypothetical protein
MSTRQADERGDEQMARLRAAADDPAAADAAANELLKALFAGYPVERVRPLLRSGQAHLVRAGIWIASELGADGAPLLDDVVRLLDHPIRYVRFFAVDAVLANAGSGHGAVTARAVRRIDDPDQAVRWKVLQLLANADRDTLAASVDGLDDSLDELVTWLIGPPDGAEIAARLGDPERAVRLFAAAAAARSAPTDPGPLTFAAGSTDEEVSSFAAERLRMVERRRH